MPVTESSILTVLRERASLKPNNTAFTFIDYQQDWDGVAENLTWSQLYRRVRNVAGQLGVCGSIGDRAVILAPQGLDYIVAFFGAMQAGLIPVPLSMPTGGAHDDRVSSVLRDASPAVILTTSSVVGDVSEYAKPQSGESAPAIVEIDLLDGNSSSGSSAGGDRRSSIAYLQYTSGSTRQPAGVMISHKNLRVNISQFVSNYFVEYGKVAPPDATMVSWLPFYHDMGLILGVCLPILAGVCGVLTTPASFVQRPARWMQLLASNSKAWSAAPNFAFDLAARKTSDDDMAGLDLGDVVHILNGRERVQPATLKRFAERFARFNLHAKVIRPSYGLAESTLYVVPAAGGAWTRITDGKHWDDKPRWSPDGKTIYFVSGRGGFFNVWGIHFDPDGGKPVGEPFRVSAFEGPGLMIPKWIPPVELSINENKLVLNMEEVSGGIWVLDNVDR